ncbi:MAG: UPF0147 family protein [Candidatus Diapherotrites archaeon]|nr:UPF0147 family protein [Candidatus Diapherotrites archaeon]
MSEDTRKEIHQLLELMQAVEQDRSVPRNIRTVMGEAVQRASAKKLKVEDLSTAIYLLDDTSNDINMPSHTRTDIWEIISKMEAIKEKIKE